MLDQFRYVVSLCRSHNSRATLPTWHLRGAPSTSLAPPPPPCDPTTTPTGLGCIWRTKTRESASGMRPTAAVQEGKLQNVPSSAPNSFKGARGSTAASAGRPSWTLTLESTVCRPPTCTAVAGSKHPTGRTRNDGGCLSDLYSLRVRLCSDMSRNFHSPSTFREGPDHDAKQSKVFLFTRLFSSI